MVSIFFVFNFYILAYEEKWIMNQTAKQGTSQTTDFQVESLESYTILYSNSYFYIPFSKLISDMAWYRYFCNQHEQSEK